MAVKSDTTAPPKLRRIIVILVLSICIGAILSLWNDVRRQQSMLNQSRSDNMQWTISQVLVEYQDMLMALHAAQKHDPESDALLNAFRQRFDVLYSRLDTLANGPIYSPLLEDPVYAQAFRRIKDRVEATVPVIDGPDDALRAALPELSTTIREMERDIRSFGLQSLISFSEKNDMLRAGLARSMNRMSVLTAAMVCTLLLMSAFLYREGLAGDRQLAIQRRTAARLDTILNTSLDAIIVAAPDGRITQFNRAAQEWLGLTEGEALGRLISDLLRPADNQAAADWDVRKFAGRGIVEMTALTLAGKRYSVELNVETVESDDRQILIAFIRDITRRKAVENELIATRDRALASERAKASFVAMMSHELRTPLNGILGMLTLLKGTQLDSLQTDFAKKMEVSGQALLRHVNDVLDISRAEVGRLDLLSQPTALEPLLRSVADSLTGAAAARGNTITFERIGPLPEHIMIDDGRLRQVLINLLGNAIKFTASGQIVLEAECLKTAAGDDVLELRVSDTGVGIAEDDLPRIFDDFETLNPSAERRQVSAGLGLAIVRRIVDAMDGEVFVESEPGEGSLFSVVLPIALVPASVSLPSKEPALAGDALRARRVLVVEDNDINRAVLRGMMAKRNCSVVEAVDGETGVVAADSQGFDLILMDVAMPGIDGIEAARLIRGGGGPSAKTPIVAVTAHADKRETEAFLRAGMTGVITKPVAPERIDDLLSGRGLSDAGRAVPVFGSDRVLDTTHLDRLRAELGQPRLSGLLGRFAAEAEAEIGWMVAAEVRQDPPPDLPARAHRLAGAATSFGAWRLGERLLRVEASARVGHRSALATHLPGLRSDWAETHGRMVQWQDESASATLQAS